MKKRASFFTVFTVFLCLLMAGSSLAGPGTGTSGPGSLGLDESADSPTYSANESDGDDGEGNAAAAPLAVVFPPDSKPFGKSFKQWTAEWWQSMFSIPVSMNPMLDSTGDRVVVGQHGPVWFLSGSWGLESPKLQRTCAIPEGKALFFPVVNYVWFDSPGVCGETNHYTVQQLRAMIAEQMDKATNLSVVVDGNSIPIRKKNRIKSKVFEVSFPEDNVYDDFCASAGGFPAGTWSPSVDDGYYLMVKPLAVGDHTIRIRSEIPGIGSLDVTYLITVLPTTLQ